MKKLIPGVDRWSSVPLGVVGVSGTRALLGFVGLMFYVSQYADRGYLFGPTVVLRGVSPEGSAQPSRRL